MLDRLWLDFTFKVTLLVWVVDRAKPIFPYQAGTLVDPTCWRHRGTNNLVRGLGDHQGLERGHTFG